MPNRFVLPMLLASSILVACGGSGSESTPETATFVFRLRGFPASEEFRGVMTSPDQIAKARDQLRLPEDQRRLFANGAIAAGGQGNSARWNWHFTTVGLSEVAFELCDATPSMVEADLDHWLNTVKGFCPWSSYVYAEVRQ